MSGLAHPRALRIGIRSLLRCGPRERSARATVVATAAKPMQTSVGFEGESEQDLKSWLQQFGVDTASYGRGAAKPLAFLLEEVHEGETVLTVAPSGTPLRLVSVLNVTLLNDRGQRLVEARQVLPSGNVRTRGLPLSEKMLPGESWQAGAVRAVKEELGPVLPPAYQLEIRSETYREQVEEKESQSYPGLTSRYVCHRVEGRLPGLPDGNFETAEERADGLLQHCWEWW